VLRERLDNEPVQGGNMFKKWYGVMVVALLLMLTVAACGGDDDDNDNGGGSADTDLSQSFDSSTGLSVKYPDDWVASDEEGMLQLASSDEVFTADTVEEGQMGILFFDPTMVSMMGGGEDASPADILGNFSGMMGDEGEFGDVSETKFGDHDGARVNVSDENTEGFMAAIQVTDDAITVVTVVTAKDDLDEHEATALDILATVSYTAPEG
jgi:hypothetical protein